MIDPMDRYLHIRAWGHVLGSFGHYVRTQAERAAQDEAPADVLYVVHRYPDGRTDVDFSDPAHYFCSVKSDRIWARYGEGSSLGSVSRQMEAYLANLREHNSVFASRA